MGKLSTPSNFSSVSSWQELRRFVSLFCSDVFNQINGHLTFSDNIQGTSVEVFFPQSNFSISVVHNLGYTPSGFFVVNVDGPAIIYRDIDRSANNVNIFFKSSVALINATVRIF